MSEVAELTKTESTSETDKFILVDENYYESNGLHKRVGDAVASLEEVEDFKDLVKTNLSLMREAELDDLFKSVEKTAAGIIEICEAEIKPNFGNEVDESGLNDLLLQVQALSLEMKLAQDKITEIFKRNNFDILTDTAAAATVPEVLATADLGSLYAEASSDAIKKTNKFGEVVFKDGREVTSDLKQIFNEKGFTLDGRESGLFEYVRGALLTIKNYETILKRDDLSDETRNKFQGLLNVEINMFLREVAGFLQTEPRDEAIDVKSETLPEAGVVDVEAEISSSVAEFVLFENLKADSPILSTIEYKNAAAAVKVVRENQTSNGGDPKVFADIRRTYQVTLEKKMRALQAKAEELGGLSALMTDEPTVILTPDPISVPEPVVPVEPAALSVPATPEPVPDKDPISVEERISLAVDAGTEFYQSLPAEFFDNSEKISKLDAAVAGLSEADKEPSQVTKAVLVATFMNALAEAKTEYEDWQAAQEAAKAAAAEAAKIEAAKVAVDVDISKPILLTHDEPKVAAEPEPTPEPAPVFDKDGNILVEEKVLSDKEAYAMYRTRSLEAKAAYQAKEAEFNNSLKNHYDGEGFLSRLRSAKKVLGINQDLPESLEALRQDMRAARAMYAESLDLALQERAQQPKNEIYSSESESTRIAFARKFILQPQAAQLAMQEKAVLSEKQRAIRDKVMGTLAKHKNMTRVGFVVAAGVAGGLSGGVGLAVAGASWKVAKIAASATMGAAAAKYTKDHFAPQVEQANKEVEELDQAIKTGQVSIKDLIATGETYSNKLATQEKVIKKQRVATVGAAVLAGGLTGYGTGLMDNSVMVEAGAARTGGVYNAESNSNATSRTAELIVEKVRGPVAIEALSVVRYAPNGDALPPWDLTNISFGPESNMAAIPEALRPAFISEVRLLASDVLAGEKHIPEAKFEAQLFEKMEAKFSQTAWWDYAHFSKVDVGNFPEHQATATFTPTQIVADATPVAEVASTPEPVVEEVTKGDTVSEILLEKFGTKFEGMSAIERGQVLDKLFTRLDQNPELIKELGLRSGDIDLIYPDEKLNLTVLERELEAELKPAPVVEPVTNKTGVLKVAVEAETESVPIKVTETIAPTVTEIKTDLSDRVYNEAPTTPKAIPAYEAPVREAVPVRANLQPLSFPKVTALNGQYLEHPQFIKLQEAVFDGNAKGYDRAITNAINILDRNTYDFTDTLFGSRYASPYTILNDMSLEDFEKFQAQPNEKLRFDLQQNNIKYETYLQWVDLVDDMKKEMPYQATTTVGDMFGRLVLDEEVAKHNINLKVKST